MIILAIETSASACSLAVLLNDKPYSNHKIMPMQQAGEILPMICDLLYSANVSLKEIDAVAFGAGPGSFTGVRIAASVAKGLAFALQVPVVPISSMAVLAQHAANVDPKVQNIVTAVDARMGEIYWATFAVVGPDRLIKPIVKEKLSIPELLLQPKTGSWLGVGNAWQIYGPRIEFYPESIKLDSNPKAEAMLSLANSAINKGEVVSALHAKPVYLRDKVTS